jgi:hypothetical protein
MSHGERQSRKSNNAGRDYFKKRGFMKRCYGWLAPVSNRAGTNKITKRLTNKSEKQQVKTWIKSGQNLD